MSDKTDKQWIKEYEDLECFADHARARGDRSALHDVQGQLFIMTQQMPEAALRRLAGRRLINGRIKRITDTL